MLGGCHDGAEDDWMLVSGVSCGSAFDEVSTVMMVRVGSALRKRAGRIGSPRRSIHRPGCGRGSKEPSGKRGGRSLLGRGEMIRDIDASIRRSSSCGNYVRSYPATQLTGTCCRTPPVFTINEMPAQRPNSAHDPSGAMSDRSCTSCGNERPRGLRPPHTHERKQCRRHRQG